MDLVDAERKEGFSFIWTIQNYNVCLRNNKDIGICYESPIFELDEGRNENWSFKIYPKRYFRQDDIRLDLQRSTDGKRRELTLEVSICDVRGSFSKVLNRNALFEVHHKRLPNLKLILNKKVLETYPNNNSLTIKCRIWQLETEVLKTRQCYARTIIGSEKIIYPCTLEDFEKFISGEKIEKRITILSEFPCFTMNLSLTGNCFAENKIEIKVTPINTNNTFFSTCEISLVDADGKVAYSVRDEYNFETSSTERVWTFPFIEVSKIFSNRQLYLPNGILHLRCEFVVSSGVKYNEVERTECGTENNHLLECSDQTTDSHLIKSLKDNLQRFYEAGKFSDLIIRTPSKDFPVHKPILCARSEVFCAMFERDMKENQTGVIEIVDVDDDTLSKMLLFMYTDTVAGDLEFGTACTLYTAADKYEILALKKKCSDFLKSSFTVTNVYDALVLADMHHDQELKSAAQSFMFERSDMLMDSEEWKQFMEEKVYLASEIMHMMLKRLKLSSLLP